MANNLNKYFVMYCDEDRELDLLVCASSRGDATSMWEDYYDLTPGDIHPSVVLIPDDFGTVPGAIAWDAMLEARE